MLKNQNEVFYINSKLIIKIDTILEKHVCLHLNKKLTYQGTLCMSKLLVRSQLRDSLWNNYFLLCVFYVCGADDNLHNTQKPSFPEGSISFDYEAIVLKRVEIY